MSDSSADRRYDFGAIARRDLHVHTPYCGHAAGPMERYVIAAMDQQLEEIGFLAHVESGVTHVDPTWLMPYELDQYWDEGRALAERYRGRIRVSLGVEVGVNPDAIPALRGLIQRRPWQRIGLSYHYVMTPDEDARFNICSRRQAQRCGLTHEELIGLNQRYYTSLRVAVTELRPTFVCHLDVLRRNFADVSQHPSVEPLVVDLLVAMRTAGTAVEVNTAGYDHRPSGHALPYPAPWILTEALRLGLDVVICSDSHAPAEVARHFARAVRDCERALVRARHGGSGEQKTSQSGRS